MFTRLERESSELDKKRRAAGRLCSGSCPPRRPRASVTMPLHDLTPNIPTAPRRRRGPDARRRPLEPSRRTQRRQPRHATTPAASSPVIFTDVTAAAGLMRARNTSGRPTNKQFLLEEMGCGVAFFDYDHDGWLDIFLVNGTRFEAASRPTSYLFHNNRDGTFTDVTVKAGLTHSGWGQACCIGDYDNDGFDDLFVSHGAATCCITTTATARSPTSPRKPASPAPRRTGLGRGLLLPRLRPRRSPRPVRRQLRQLRSRESATPRRRGLLPLQRHPRALRSARIRRRHEHPLSQPRRWHVRRCLGSVRNRAPARRFVDGVRPERLAALRLLRHGRRGRRLRQRRLARHLRRVRQRAQPALSQQPGRHVPRNRRPRRLRLRRTRRRPLRHGRRHRRLRRRRTARHHPHELLGTGPDAHIETMAAALPTRVSEPDLA